MNPAPPVTIAVDISGKLPGTREHPFERLDSSLAHVFGREAPPALGELLRPSRVVAQRAHGVRERPGVPGSDWNAGVPFGGQALRLTRGGDQDRAAKRAAVKQL